MPVWATLSYGFLRLGPKSLFKVPWLDIFDQIEYKSGLLLWA